MMYFLVKVRSGLCFSDSIDFMSLALDLFLYSMDPIDQNIKEINLSIQDLWKVNSEAI